MGAMGGAAGRARHEGERGRKLVALRRRGRRGQLLPVHGHRARAQGGLPATHGPGAGTLDVQLRKVGHVGDVAAVRGALGLEGGDPGELVKARQVRLEDGLCRPLPARGDALVPFLHGRARLVGQGGRSEAGLSKTDGRLEARGRVLDALRGARRR